MSIRLIRKILFFLFAFCASAVSVQAASGVKYYAPPTYLDAGIQILKKESKDRSAVFQNATAAFTYDKTGDLLTGLKIAIDTTSLTAKSTDTTMNLQRLLETTSYSEMTFVEKGSTKFENNKATVKGLLSVKGQTQEISFEATKGDADPEDPSSTLNLSLTGSVPFSDIDLSDSSEGDASPTLKLILKIRAVRQ